MKIANKLSKIIVVVGPTASGKTDLALYLAKKFNGEIICADSRTVYKNLDIGTAKPYIGKKYYIKNNIYIIDNIPHYFINIAEPNRRITLAYFKKTAHKIIDDIGVRNKIPIVVGGTGLYIDSLVQEYEIPRVAPDRRLRLKLEKQIKRYGENWFYQKLLKLDPDIKKFIDPKNHRRVIRAMEVIIKTGGKFSELRKKNNSKYKNLILGINLPREELYNRINKRVKKMIESGLINEVKKIAKKYSWSHSAMSGIGYRQFKDYLKEKETLDQAINSLKRDTRHYAKRQMTWFKRNKDIVWLNFDGEKKDFLRLCRKAEEIYKNFINN